MFHFTVPLPHPHALLIQSTGDDAVEDVDGSLTKVNIQNTSLCSTTFTDLDYTYCLIKVLEICVLVFTVLGFVCTVVVLFHLCILLLFVLSVLV